jgi:hypothetical protein
MPHAPFRLGQGQGAADTTYEIDLVLNGVRHEYGVSHNGVSVSEEWAYRWPKGRRALLFHRTSEHIEFGSSARAASRAVANLLRPNALYLSTAAAVDHPALAPLYAWFGRNLRYAEEDTRGLRQMRTIDLLQDPERRDDVLELLRVADLGIDDAEVRPVELDPEFAARLERAARIIAGNEDTEESLPFDPSAVLKDVCLVHHSSDGPVRFDANDESKGTLVWLGLIGPVIDALTDGAIILADELDASLHPALIRQLVRLFQNAATNPNRAQLIVNLHDVTLLGAEHGSPLIGRDQCWFTEKHDDGSTHLLSLADRAPRKGESIAARYLRGRYGGVPVLSDAEFDIAVGHLLDPADTR